MICCLEAELLSIKDLKVLAVLSSDFNSSRKYLEKQMSSNLTKIFR
jgi:hypothetical protein